MTMRLKETSGIEEAIGLDKEASEPKGIGRGTEDDVQGPIVFCGESDPNKLCIRPSLQNILRKICGEGGGEEEGREE